MYTVPITSPPSVCTPIAAAPGVMADDVQSIAQAYMNSLPAGSTILPGSPEEAMIARNIAVALGTDLSTTLSVIRQISGASPALIQPAISPFTTTTAPAQQPARSSRERIGPHQAPPPDDTVRVSSPRHVEQELTPVAARESFWHTDHGKTVRNAAIGAVVVYVVTKIIDRVVS